MTHLLEGRMKKNQIFIDIVTMGICFITLAGCKPFRAKVAPANILSGKVPNPGSSNQLPTVPGAPGETTCATSTNPNFNRDVKPILDSKCILCHRTDFGGAIFDSSSDDKQKYSNSIELWHNMVSRIHNVTRPMPPKGSPTLSACEMATVKQWVQLQANPGMIVQPPPLPTTPTPSPATPPAPTPTPPAPVPSMNPLPPTPPLPQPTPPPQNACTPSTDTGRVTAKRLSNAEFQNTVRDLLGINYTISSDFPYPRVGASGFSTDSAVLSFDAQVTQALFNAAEEISNLVDLANNIGPNNKVVICDYRVTDANASLSCAGQIIYSLASRAYRRPLEAPEKSKLMNLYSTFDTDKEKSLRAVINAILVSPQFLMKYTISTSTEGTPYKISEHELAARLAQTIWGTNPDKTLLDLAQAKTLSSEQELRRQVLRMLRDPKSKYLTQGFANEWTGLNKLDRINLDSQRYPDFNSTVRAAMKQETELYADRIFREDLPITDFVNGNYTYINSETQKIYGTGGALSNQFTLFSLTNLPRAGILTHPSMMAVYSTAVRSAPTARGHWVLEKFLCAEPPAPPPNIPALPFDPVKDTESSIREKMAIHRSQPTCTGCHTMMDPIGLGLENFDAFGKFRRSYIDGKPVDASGSLPDGSQFKEATDIAKIVAADPRFGSCFTKHFVSYAIGRAMQTKDKCAIENIAAQQTGANKKFSDLVYGIVSSPLFQTQIGEAP